MARRPSGTDVLDLPLAENEKNLADLKSLHARTPQSIYEALRVRRESACLRFLPSGQEFCGSVTTGIVEYTLQDLGPARTFENYMLSVDNRDNCGMLLVDGKSISGYYTYDAIAVPLKASLQASRSTAPKDPRWFVEKCPGSFGMLCEVFSYLGLPIAEWTDRLVAFHGLVADGTHQLSFSWHCDCEDVTELPNDTVTTVVQCSDGVTGMRLLGHDVFLYSRGRVAIFPGMACHQTVPRADCSGPPVVKAVYFLRRVLKAQVWKCPSSKPLAVLLSEYPPSDVDGDADACPLWKSCLQFVLERREFEFLEEGAFMPGFATEEAAESDSITTVRGSALSGLWTALQRRRKYADYGAPDFYVEYNEAPAVNDPRGADAIRVTGIVWFSPLDAHEASVYRIAAFKGGGVAFLSNFCAFMRTRGFRQLRAPMKSCIVKRGAWLQSLGWRENLGRAGGVLHDGDILNFDLQGDTLNGDDQPKPAKRVKRG